MRFQKSIDYNPATPNEGI